MAPPSLSFPVHCYITPQFDVTYGSCSYIYRLKTALIFQWQSNVIRLLWLADILCYRFLGREKFGTGSCFKRFVAKFQLKLNILPMWGIPLHLPWLRFHFQLYILSVITTFGMIGAPYAFLKFGGLGSILRQSAWHLCWTLRHLDGVFSKYIGLSLSLSFYYHPYWANGSGSIRTVLTTL
jgi:hypothetical protein